MLYFSRIAGDDKIELHMLNSRLIAELDIIRIICLYERQTIVYNFAVCSDFTNHVYE